MPTSPRDLTDRTGGMIRINHPLWPWTFRADVGIRPYAGGRFLPLNLARPILSCVPSTPADKRAAPSPSRRGHELLVLGGHKNCGFSHYLGPVLWEGWVPLIRPGLRPVHLKRRGRLPPAGDEGRYRLCSPCRPTPVRAFALPPSPGRGSLRI